MFAFLLEHLGRWFERAEQRRKEEYLAGARDLAELEAHALAGTRRLSALRLPRSTASGELIEYCDIFFTLAPADQPQPSPAGCDPVPLRLAPELQRGLCDVKRRMAELEAREAPIESLR